MANPHGYSVHVPDDLVVVLRQHASTLDVPLAVYVRAVLTGAVRTGRATDLALAVIGDVASKMPVPSGTLVAWDYEKTTGSISPTGHAPKTYRYGPWTLAPLHRQGHTKPVWLLTGPGLPDGGTRFEMAARDAQREASLHIRRHEADHPERGDAAPAPPESLSEPSRPLSGPSCRAPADVARERWEAERDEAIALGIGAGWPAWEDLPPVDRERLVAGGDL